MTIGEIIKHHRQKLGFKQHQFAEVCNISQTYLCQIEKGTKIPSVEILEGIARQLKIPLGILFTFMIKEENVPERKKDAFKIIHPIILSLINSLYLDEYK